MSINRKLSVRCPKCGAVSDITVWSSITADDSPDLKKDLLSGRINMFRCPDCEAAALMPEPMLYSDSVKKLMISFYPTNDPVQKQERYEQIIKSSKESGELKALDGWNLRFLTDHNELLEKLLIFENGLNDKAIEVIKLMILSQEPDKSESRVCRFGKDDGNMLEFMIHDFIENMIYTSSVPKDSYEQVYTSLIQSGMKPYSFDWEMVDASYATRLLNGFNNIF